MLAAIAEERCTAIHGVPTMFIAELEHPRFTQLDLTSLRTGIMAGAPCPPALMQRVMTDLHCAEILIGYGETEASPLTHLTIRARTPWSAAPRPSAEPPPPGGEGGGSLLRQNAALGRGRRDLLSGLPCHAGATTTTRRRRAKPSTRTAGCTPATWAAWTQDGYVRITGRLKEMIIRGGENIYPREIEDYLFTHPKVAGGGRLRRAGRFLRRGDHGLAQAPQRRKLTEEEIRAFCRGRIAHYKIPRYIWFVEEFPMTVTGKLQKYKMRELAVARLKQDKDGGGGCPLGSKG